MKATVNFCGETREIGEAGSITIGREGDIVVDDNPYLHRNFLTLTVTDGLAWLHNVGAQISATVADIQGLTQTWLAPGARVPLVFPHTSVWFTAGPTTYDVEIMLDSAPMVPTPMSGTGVSDTTIGPVTMTPDQRRMVVALAESILKRGLGGKGNIPSSAAAAERLGWTVTKFNRKLDNVCHKLSRTGVTGLVGSTGSNASSRRTRLVEYALAARLVTPGDLVLLDMSDEI